jgi:hypothetical protein
MQAPTPGAATAPGRERVGGRGRPLIAIVSGSGRGEGIGLPSAPAQSHQKAQGAGRPKGRTYHNRTGQRNGLGTNCNAPGSVKIVRMMRDDRPGASRRALSVPRRAWAERGADVVATAGGDGAFVPIRHRDAYREDATAAPGDGPLRGSGRSIRSGRRTRNDRWEDRVEYRIELDLRRKDPTGADFTF